MSNPIVGVKSVTTGQGAGGGELSKLHDSDTQYEITKYPLDLGSSDVLHWVTFYINLPTSSKTEVTVAPGVQSATLQNSNALGKGNAPISATQAAGAVAGSAITGFLTGGWKGAIVGGAVKGVVAAGIASIDTKPKLKRIKRAISIYMPDTVVADYGHSYQQESLTDALGSFGKDAALAGGLASKATNALGALGVPLAAGAAAAGVTSSAGSAEATGQMLEKTGQVGKQMTDFALKGAGASINPQVELMFKGTDNREFVFQFTFVPKTSEEAQSIKEIIRLFKTFAAPEYNGDQGGRYFINPGQFDIEFFFNGNENINLNRISTCVLENIMVNYSPQQFTTFQDGMPAEITMQLRFKEADIMYRELIQKYGY